MEEHHGKSENVLVVVEEVETCLPGPTDVAGIINTLVENACDRITRFESVRRPSDGCGMALRGMSSSSSRANIEVHQELLGTIEYLKKQLNGLMTTVERKNRMLKGVSEETQVSQGGLGMGREAYGRGG